METILDELPSICEYEDEIPQLKFHLSKHQKREAHWQKVRENKQQKRKRKKLEKKERDRKNVSEDQCIDNDKLCKRDLKRLLVEKNTMALKSGLRVCIDLSLEGNMSEKEKGRLAQQLGRIYGCNRKTENPLHIFLTGFDQSGTLFMECARINQGFQKYLWDITEKPYTELFPKSDVIYLTPDSKNILFSIEPDKVYIVGGLVDESIQKMRVRTSEEEGLMYAYSEEELRKHMRVCASEEEGLMYACSEKELRKHQITLKNADKNGIQTACLPIDVFMMKGGRQGKLSRILTVNQVIAIISEFIKTKDWKYSLSAGVPPRTGLVFKPVTDKETADITTDQQMSPMES